MALKNDIETWMGSNYGTVSDAAQALADELTKYFGSVPVEAGPPLDGEAPIYDSGNGQFEFGAPTGGAHAIGGANHTASTLALLNTKISDATVDNAGSSRPPTSHGSSHQNGSGDEISVAGLSGLLADAQTPAAHGHSHVSTTGRTANDHHNEDHASRHAASGADRMASLDIFDSGTQLLRFLAGVFSLNSTGSDADKGAFHIQTFSSDRTSSAFASFLTFDSFSANGDQAVALIFAIASKKSDAAFFDATLERRAFWRKGGTSNMGTIGTDDSLLNGGEADNHVRLNISGDNLVVQKRGDGSNSYRIQGFVAWIKGDLS